METLKDQNTSISEVVKYRISNFIRIEEAFFSGAAASAVISTFCPTHVLPRVAKNHTRIMKKKKFKCKLDLMAPPINPEREVTSRTFPPGKDFIFQTNASFSGAYAAEPMIGLVASEVTGSSAHLPRLSQCCLVMK